MNKSKTIQTIQNSHTTVFGIDFLMKKILNIDIKYEKRKRVIDKLLK